METNDLTSAIIGAAIEVHRRLGPGLLESAYRVCLAYELNHGDTAQIGTPRIFGGGRAVC